MKKKHLLLFLAVFISLTFASSTQAQSGTLYFVPASGTFAPGQTFSVTIMVDTKGENVNAIGAYFSYPQNELEVLEVDTTGSVMTLFAEQQGGGGKVDISGGKPTPGFSGIQKIASVRFRVKASSGVATLTFDQSSAVLRDSDNQNILSLSSSGKGVYTFGTVSAPPPQPPQPPQPSPAPPPQPPEEESLVISDITVSKATEDSVIVSWKTNREANSRIDYGQTVDYDFSILDGELTTDHSLFLFDGMASDDYHFRITSIDSMDNVAVTEDLLISSLPETLVSPPSQPPQEQDGETEPRRSPIGVPIWILFVILPIVILIVGIILFSRRRQNQTME